MRVRGAGHVYFDEKSQPPMSSITTEPEKIEKTDSSCGIVLVDDHPIFRRGLAQFIDKESDCCVRGEAADAQQAMSVIGRVNPDLVIADISLQGSNGIELVKSLKAAWPDLKILVLSTHDEALYAERALRAGALGYVMKQESPDSVLLAIRKVLEGKVYVSPDMSTQMISKLVNGGHHPAASPIDGLSDRELEVLEKIGHGRSSRQIAEELRLSVKTIESHRAHIKQKLNLTTSNELVRFAVQWLNDLGG